MKIRFIGGAELECAEAKSVYDLAAEASLISREVIAAKVNGEVVDLTTPVSSDAEIELLTFDHEDGQRVFNHTASHILAQAVKNLFPETKLAIGPSTDNGFYYDFDTPKNFDNNDLEEIEKEIDTIIFS